MFGILFRAEVKPEERENFINFINWDIQVAMEREPGTLRFDLYRDPKDEAAFFVYEAYRDEKAFEEHQKNEPFQRWDSEIRWRMLRAPPSRMVQGGCKSSLTTTTDGERAFRTSVIRVRHYKPKNKVLANLQREVETKRREIADWRGGPVSCACLSSASRLRRQGT